jgi:hypothetical protein
VSNNKDCQIGRKVVCALLGVIFTADRAAIDRLYKSPKQLAFAAMRAAALKSAPHRLTQIAGRACSFLAFTTENVDLTIRGIGL